MPVSDVLVLGLPLSYSSSLLLLWGVSLRGMHFAMIFASEIAAIVAAPLDDSADIFGSRDNSNIRDGHSSVGSDFFSSRVRHNSSGKTKKSCRIIGVVSSGTFDRFSNNHHSLRPSLFGSLTHKYW